MWIGAEKLVSENLDCLLQSDTNQIKFVLNMTIWYEFGQVSANKLLSTIGL